MIRIKHPGTMVAGVVFMLIGASYLLEAFNVWDVNFKIWPIFLVEGMESKEPVARRLPRSTRPPP